MKLKVLIADKMSDAAIDRFYKNSIATTLATDADAQELTRIIGEFHGLAVRSRTQVTPELLRHAHALRVIGRAGIGVDNIDVPSATRAGIVVMNTPDGNAVTTAEHTLAMMFSLARHIPAANASTQKGAWEKSKFVGMELAEKTLGVVGCGKIGSIVATRALALNLQVIAHDPFLSEQRALSLGIEKVSLEELLERSHIITLHVPSSPQTDGMISADTIAKMRPGVHIINCARGTLINEADLAAALVSGQVGGAAIDVFSTEPARENVLFGVPNVVATPHLGASTGEAQEKVAVQLADQMSAFLQKNVVTNAVNVPALSAEEAKQLEPNLTLAKQLGLFAAQVTQSPIQSVNLTLEGQAAALNTDLIRNAVLAALLSRQLQHVNIVNANELAKERHIGVSQTTKEVARDYQSLLTLSVETNSEQVVLQGTVFGGDKPRMVGIQNIQIEFELVPQMLYLVTVDIPGVIGSVSSVLGGEDLNISALHMGRSTAGGDAIALFGLDGEVSSDVIDKVRAVPSVREATLVSIPKR